MEAAADVARFEEVQRVFGAIEKEMPPLHGIFHVAGVLDDGMLAQQDWQRFASVMSSKVLGAWNLHLMTERQPVGFFVMFSSITALLGSPGQANYATANAFLDGLAEYRFSKGQAALSIAWGPWSQIGLAAKQGNRGDRLALRGLAGISPETGVVALERLCAQGEARCAVMNFDLAQWCTFYPKAASAAFLSSLRGPAATPVASGKEEDVRAALLAIEAGPRRRSKLEDFLREQIAWVLKTSPARIALNQPLENLGLDSLLALELANRLEGRLAMKMPGTLIWNYPTVAALAPHLAEKMGIPLEPAEAKAPVTSNAFDELSDLFDEIEQI